MKPILQLAVLSALSLVGCRQYLRPGPSPTASGAIVMAIGIFVLDAMQRMPIPGLLAVTRLVTLELLVIWALIAASYLASWANGTLFRHTTDPVNRFAVGTWVAGTSVLGQAVLLAFPSWRPLGLALGFGSVLLWVWFLTLVFPGFQAIANDPTGEYARGRILLSTVSTQAVVIFATMLFPGYIPRWLLIAGIGVGCLSYAVGTTLVALRYLGQRGWRLSEDWDNTNCILHGAVSITGLAAMASGAFAASWLIALWLLVVAVFLVVEGVELARAHNRIRLYGWRRGVLTYSVSQWARNFTFGMFYAFTLHLYVGPRAADGTPDLREAWSLIAHYGQYVVLALLLVEAALFLHEHARSGRTLAALPPTRVSRPGIPCVRAAVRTRFQWSDNCHCAAASPRPTMGRATRSTQRLEHIMAIVTQPLRDEHAQLLPHIEQLRVAADSVSSSSVDDVWRHVEESYEFLSHHLLPHAEAEEGVLYPTVGNLLGASDATATMRRDHVEVRRLTEELGALRSELRSGQIDQSTENELRRALYGLYTRVKVHFAKEEEVYLPLLDSRLSTQEADALFARMGHAAGEAGRSGS